MTIFQLIVAIGVSVSAVVIALVILVDVMQKRRRRASTAPIIAKTFLPSGTINVGLLLSKLGQSTPAGRSLDTMVLRPTWGIKLFGVLILCALASVMVGPAGELYRQDLMSWIMTGGIVVYLVAFMLVYEVRYDSEGITAPGMFFQPKFYAWDAFISIEMTDSVHYKLVFDDGTLKIKKFLTGMDTLTAFAAGLRNMNRQR